MRAITAIALCLLGKLPLNKNHKSQKYGVILMCVFNRLCILAGSVFAAEHNFRVGKQYTFHAKSESLVGIPKLADQDAGLRLKQTIQVIAKDASTLVFIVSFHFNVVNCNSMVSSRMIMNLYDFSFVS